MSSEGEEWLGCCLSAVCCLPELLLLLHTRQVILVLIYVEVVTVLCMALGHGTWLRAWALMPVEGVCQVNGKRKEGRPWSGGTAGMGYCCRMGQDKRGNPAMYTTCNVS